MPRPPKVMGREIWVLELWVGEKRGKSKVRGEREAA